MNASQLNKRMARIHARERGIEPRPLAIWNGVAWAMIVAGPAWFLVLLAIHFLRRFLIL